MSVALCCLLAGITCGGERDRAPGDEVTLPPDTTGIAADDPERENGTVIDTLVMQARGALVQRPVAPLRVDGACPFECCTYGDWTATAETTVYEESDRQSATRTLPAGTRLEADSGFVVLTEIGVAIVRDTVRMCAEDGGERLATVGDTLFIPDHVGGGVPSRVARGIRAPDRRRQRLRPGGR